MNYFRPLLLCLPALLTACTGSPIRLHIPQNRFELPETATHERFTVEVGYKFDEYTISFTDNAQTEPIQTTNPELIKTEPNGHKGSDNNIKLMGRYGMMDRLEIYLAIEDSSILGLKYQFLGKSRKNSVEGDFSSAVSIAYGNLSEDDEDDDYTLKSNYWDYSVLGGYKITDRVLLYTGAFKSNYHYSIRIAPHAINQNKEKFSGDAYVQGATLGINIMFGKHMDFTFEALNSHIETGGSELDELFYGIKLGLLY